MKFTIFGHKGFLGRNIIDYLNINNIQYYLPPRNKYVFKKNLGNIIYCIGDDNVLKNPLNSVNANLKILYEILEKNRFQSFLFISSTRVYLNSKDTKENSIIKIDPQDPKYQFNILKLASENFCLSKNNKRIKVVRLSNLFGEYFSNQIYLLPNLLKNAKRKKIIKIMINKKSKKNYLYVNDAISLIFRIIKKSKYRIYNLASDKLYSIEFILNEIKKKTSCKIIYSNQNTRYDEPKINITRVKKEFKFKPSNNFKSFLNNFDFNKKV